MRIVVFLLGMLVMTTQAIGSTTQAVESTKTIGLLGAMDVEVEALLAKLTDKKMTTIANIDFHQGQLKGKNVVIAKSGVGKVFAAMTTTLMLEKFDINQLVFTGVAGAASSKVDVKDLVVASALVQHDVDLTVFGNKKGQLDGYDNVAFTPDQKLTDLAFKTAVSVLGEEQVHLAVVATGDQFIADKKLVNQINTDFNAFAVEMEGAAVAQVAQNFKVPYAVIRTLSDKADGSAHLTYEELKKVAADNSTRIVLKMLESL